MLTVLMITGPMSGSTGGGMKLSRVMILCKSTYRAIARTVTPNSVHLIHLDGEIVEEDTGTAEVRETFKVPKVGTIAGCYITDGELHRDDKVRIVRDGTVIFEGEIASLRRFKDDVQSVKEGYEAGINLGTFNDIELGDIIETFEMREVERK